MLILIISLFLVLISMVHGDDVVMTTNGPVQGVTVQSEGHLLEAYLGIPYAEPPIGRLRFENPVPKSPWKGVYDASRLPPSCIQNVTTPSYFTPDISNMSEDCLNLNIWVPHSEVDDTKLKTILFYLHGGAYNIGSSNMKLYDGAKLAARGDVVVVTINYRIGAMGFFLSLINNAGGNMGVRDMILAMKWIRSNAVSFHADPESIVLIGESAGAITASAFVMSPATKHMIKRVIVQSGTPMMTYVLDDNVRLHKQSQMLATLVGCSDKKITLEKHPRKVVKCLKSLSPTEISRAEGILMGINPITFIPRMNDDILPVNTVQMIRNGYLKDTEMLIGITEDEGSFFLAAAAPQYFGVYGSDPATISKNLAHQLIRTIHGTMQIEGPKEVSEYYVNSVLNGTSEKYLRAISQSLGDVLITCPTMFQAEFHSVKSPTYFYKLTYRSASSLLADWMGVTHFDDVQYVFGNPMIGNFTEQEQILSDRMMKRWISFAKTGNPNIPEEREWPLFSYKNHQYLDINVKERVLHRPDDYRCEFWRERLLAILNEDIIQKLQSSATVLTVKVIYFAIPVILSMVHKL